MELQFWHKLQRDFKDAFPVFLKEISFKKPMRGRFFRFYGEAQMAASGKKLGCFYTEGTILTIQFSIDKDGSIKVKLVRAEDNKLFLFNYFKGDWTFSPEENGAHTGVLEIRSTDDDLDLTNR